MAKVTVNIVSRWDASRVLFSAEVSAELSFGARLGVAARLAISARADLTGASLRDADLTGAVLTGADLTCADLTCADLTCAVLRGADLMGADLTGASLRDADLTGASLTGAVLTRADLTGADLTDASLRDASLRDADLTGASLRDADLTGAVLRDTDLRDTPSIHNIHQAVYAAGAAPGALNMGDWHTCETTHCRAGWVVTLAGEAGRDLETRVGTSAAATLIYLASDPQIGRFPDFYCSNDEALADMKARAEAEAAKVSP